VSSIQYVDSYVNNFFTSNVFITKLILGTPINKYKGGSIRADIFVINNDVIIRQCTTGTFYEPTLYCTFTDVLLEKIHHSKKEFQLQIVLTPLEVSFQHSIQLSILESMRGIVHLSKRRTWAKFFKQVLFAIVLSITGSITCCVGIFCSIRKNYKKQVV